MKFLKQEKGSISLFVIIAMLFFVMYLVGMYMISANAQNTQIAETEKIKQIYEAGVNNIDDIYATLVKSNNDKVNGYISDGLMVYYDAKQIESIQNGIIKDLSNNGNDGKINGVVLENGALKFDGIDDYIGIKELNYPNITIEAVVEYEAVPESTEVSIISNFQAGGYSLTNYATTGNTPYNKFTINIDGTYYSVSSKNQIRIGTKYSLSGSYDGRNVLFSENGIKDQTEKVGNIRNPIYNTIIAVGTNPYKDLGYESYFKGKIYAIRIYNRAITQEEIDENYRIDKLRFEI